MEAFRYSKIDAFTAGKSLGNPAACLYLRGEQSLSDAEMLAIAKQHKGFVSEVIFCTEKAPLSFGLTYYSSECEVEFCGHGTIACMAELIREMPELLHCKEIVIDTHQKGSLTVYNKIAKQNAVYITAPLPRYIGSQLAENGIAESLSFKGNQLSDALPIDLIDAGLRTLIVPAGSLQDEISVFPDEQTLKNFCLQNEIDIVLIFTLETDQSENLAHTRVFAPRFGYLEDPATGSGNSAFGYYMLKNNLWNGSDVTIEQGGADRVFNRINLSCKDGRVLFGGGATTRIKGIYFL